MASLYSFGDHVRVALSRMLDQDKPRAIERAIVSILVDRYQRIEDALWQMGELRWIDTATGAQLDVLGAIVGEDREGRDDSTYRLWVKARARANRSAGRPDDALDVLRLVVEPTASIEYVDITNRDAEMRVNVSGSQVDPAQLKAIVGLTKPAGVQMDIVLDSGADAFAFDGGTDGLGYDDGYYADVI